MQVHNPLNQSRLCHGLGRNLEPYEVADVPAKFEKCDSCKCVLMSDKPAAGKDA